MLQCIVHGSSMITECRVLFVQFGDFRAASERMARGEPETYYAQDYSVSFVERLAETVQAVKIIELDSAQTQESQLSSGIVTEGMRYYRGRMPNTFKLLWKIRKYSPTHIVLRTPLSAVLEYAIFQKVHILPLFADSFYLAGKSILSRCRLVMRYRRLARVLNNPAIEFVANHNIPSCISLSRIGVDKNKIVPWDWPPLPQSELFPAKELQIKKRYSLFYAGAISREKGVADLIMALPKLQEKGVCVELALAGTGGTDEMAKLAEQVGVEQLVHFLGQIGNDVVRKMMHESDIVVVPSRHSYPEGLPKTINEALSASTPLVVSDHPIFTKVLKHKINVLFFEAGNAEDLAETLASLLGNPTLYRELSRRSHVSYSELFVQMEWKTVIEEWLTGAAAQPDWVRARCLSCLRRL